MSHSSRLTVPALVHQALVARVRLLLGQSDFTEMLDTQDRVSGALARLAAAKLSRAGVDGNHALRQVVCQALELDPGYYGRSELEFVVAEGLTSAGMVLAECVQGHEQDSRAQWAAQVVPSLDRVAAFVVSVFDGSWARQPQGLGLRDWLRQAPSV